MKHFATFCLLLLAIFSIQSQTYEVGVMIGGSNYIGDIGKTNYIYPNDLAVGGIFKWNRSPRHSFRGSLLYAKIKADDANSGNNRREQRGYSFENSIKEISIGMEFNFWEFDVHSGKKVHTPYLYTGLTSFLYNSSGALDRGDDGLAHLDNPNIETGIDIAIPMVVGYKAKLSHSAMLGFEIGARYTLSDNLDGSSNYKKDEPRTARDFGNIHNDDWYVFTGITFTFAFGRLPCYCNF